MAGVLIALTTDSWLQYRADRDAEAGHLDALSTEFQESLSALAASIESKETQIAQLGRFLNSRVADLPPDSIEGWVYCRDNPDEAVARFRDQQDTQSSPRRLAGPSF